MELFLKALMGLLSAALFLIVSVLVFEGIDRIGVPSTWVIGRVVGREYRAPYTSMVMIGKVMVPQRHSASYKLQVVGPRGVVVVTANESSFTLANNSLIKYQEVKGRISGHIYTL
jgi:hypothetical protein